MIFNQHMSGINTKNATAKASDILYGKTAFVDGEIVVGSMADNGSVSKTLSTTGSSYTIPKGYHNGSGKVTASITNLTAANIKSGVMVGGVTGTAPTVGSGFGLKKTVYFNNVSTSSTSSKTITPFTKNFDVTKTFEIYVFQGTNSAKGGLRIAINPVTFAVVLYTSRDITSTQINVNGTAFPSNYYTYTNKVLTISCYRYQYYVQGSGSSSTGDYITLDIIIDFNTGTITGNKAEIYWYNGSSNSTYGVEIFGIGCY